MSLLTTYETNKLITEYVSKTVDQLHIVSAFCKVSVVDFLDKNVKHQLKSKKLLVRFLLSDILYGATDFSLYEYCKSHDWQLYIRFDLHAKTYIFDRKRCILGSANLTSKGVGISQYSNYELSCVAEVEETDLKKIDELYNNAILMTDELYDEMKIDYDKACKKGFGQGYIVKWNSDIVRKVISSVDILFTYDFPSVFIPDYNNIKCFEFLELNNIPTKDELKEVFRCSKAFLWLYNFVSKSKNKETYFGAISSALHEALINDPKPYRKDVKKLLVNTLGWIQELELTELVVDVPNHSQRIRII